MAIALIYVLLCLLFSHFSFVFRDRFGIVEHGVIVTQTTYLVQWIGRSDKKQDSSMVIVMTNSRIAVNFFLNKPSTHMRPRLGGHDEPAGSPAGLKLRVS